jgi:hypothetical protein
MGILEITKDIVIKMIENNMIKYPHQAGAPVDSNKNAAMAVAEAFKIIYKTVSNPIEKAD